MARPRHLPDFSNPPLNEVVLGVQFAPIIGYQQIYAGEVWELFKKDFPVVQEHPALPPQFETFGYSPPQPAFEFIGGIMPSRHWFITSDQFELIQFQQDKFLHNWRKVGDGSNEYPRFEKILGKYTTELGALEKYFKNKFAISSILINQCEVSYINFINLVDFEDASPGDIFSFLNFGNSVHEVSCNFNRYILNDRNEPTGRVRCTLNQGIGDHGPTYRLEIRVVGAPKTPTIADALNFIENGRETIVNLFKEVTTTSAHRIWGIKE